MHTTTLKLLGNNFPPFSQQECRETLKTIQLGSLKRTVNGKLCYIGGGTKYQSLLEGNDSTPPCLNQLARGDHVTLHSTQRLWQDIPPNTDQALSLILPAVPETLLVCNAAGEQFPFELIENELSLKTKTDQTLFISFRPVLEMLVVEISLKHEEDSLQSAWRVLLEEV